MAPSVSSPLFEPLRIGSVTVPNRIMQTAHSKQYSDVAESDRETEYYVRRARGGCGLFIAGNHFVHPSASIRWFEDAYRTDTIGASRRMTDAIHEAGSRVFVQLNHHGAQAQPEGPFGPRPVYAPSRLISPSTGHATTAASAADIRSFVEGWALSAENAREGGFDGVEIHMAHGYLLHQFLSPLYNARTDGYGGDLEGRTRFPREVLRAVRERVGDDFTVGIRICANEFHPDGLDGAAWREVIARLRDEARIDFLDLAAGGYHNVHYVFPSSPMPAAWLREDVAAVKRDNPDVPVFGVGAALSVERAEEVLAGGIADMVALTRGQLADPDLATKLREGRSDEIRHCIRLNQGCLGRGSTGLPVSCTVNPVAGRELERGERGAAATAERIAVVGGGPAGMRAAVELAGDGHRVTLFEAGAELGGQLLRARRVPGRETIGLLVDDLRRDLAAAGVDVRLGTRAGTDELRGADRVVLASGATAPEGTSLAAGSAFAPPAVRDDARAGEEEVAGPGPEVVDAFTALADPAALGERIAVVDSDGTAYASGVVLSLLSQASEAELVTPFEQIFPHVGAGYDRPLLMEQLSAHEGFRRRASHVVDTVDRLGHELAGSGRDDDVPLRLRVRDTLTGEHSALEPLDAVVAIEPRSAVRPAEPENLSARLGGIPVHTLGDAVSPRNIDAAIYDAVELAYAVAAG